MDVVPRDRLSRLRLWLNRSLARKVGLLLAVMLTGLAVSLAVASDDAHEQVIRRQLGARASALADMQARLAAVQLSEGRLEDLNRAVAHLREIENVAYAFVLDRSNLLLTDGGAGGQILVPIEDPLATAARARRDGVLEFDDHLLHVAQPVPLGDGRYGVVRLGLALESMHAEIAWMRLRAITIGVAFLAIGIGCSLILLRPITRSLELLTESMRAAALGRFAGRIHIDTQDELEVLANAFNRMLEALERSTVSRDYMNKILNTMSEALVVVTPQGRIRMVNAASCRLLGLRDEDLVGRPYDLLLADSPEPADRMITAFRRGDRHEPVEATYRAASGDRIPVLVSGAAMDDRSSIVLVAQDIRVRKLAYFDAVTELPNRIFFQQLLDKAIAQARDQQHKLAVLFIDLDHFKLVNDSYGHDAGDQLLKIVGERIAACVRGEDVVVRAAAEHHHQLARLGGDEFTLLLASIESEQEAEAVSERVLRVLGEPFDIGGRQIMVGTSIGIAIYPDHGLDAAALIKSADTAMYHAKRQGRNNAQFFSARLEQTAAAQLMMENELRRAVARGALALQYQPQIATRTGAVTGVEALLRWQHPELGVVAPGQLMPVAEATGLIVPIGQWALRTACAQAKDWLDAGIGPLRMAVNISGIQLGRDDFVEQVKTVLLETHLPPSLLELEITELAAAANAELTAHKLRELQAMGVQIAIDDFGTGYSSLDYLKRFPVDRVKIDRSFIQHIADQPGEAAFLRAVLAMAFGLRVSALAVGVESRQQVEILRQSECAEIQGFYASPPLPPDELVPWLLEWQKRCRAEEQAIA